MDLKKAQDTLLKIQRLNKIILEYSEGIPAAKLAEELDGERKLMLKYIKDLYVSFSGEILTPPATKPVPGKRKLIPKKMEKKEIPLEIKTPPKEKKEPAKPKLVPKKELPKPPEPKPELPKPKSKPAPEPPVVKKDPPKPKPKPTPPPPKPQTVISGFNKKYNELFNIEEAKDIASKLNQTPLKTLKRMAINDRLLYTNELFGKDANAFSETIDTLNQLNSLDRARQFLEQKIMDKYDWADEEKMKHARDFVVFIRRRYL